jgi:hypothetical protein
MLILSNWPKSVNVNLTSKGESKNYIKKQNISEFTAGTTGPHVRLKLGSLAQTLRLNPTLVFPLIFHSIADEIPEASRPLITRLYQLWLVLLFTLIINMVACVFVLLAGSSDGGRDLGGSIG